MPRFGFPQLNDNMTVVWQASTRPGMGAKRAIIPPPLRETMRPTLRLLQDGLTERIIAEGREVLCRLGVEIHNKLVLGLLGDHGAEVDVGKCETKR
jgi:hypothetical protein